jgi:hypothetical protein
MKYKPISLWSHCHSASQSNLLFSTQRKSTSQTIHFHQFPQNDERVLSSESLWRCNSLAIYVSLTANKSTSTIILSLFLSPRTALPVPLSRRKGYIGLGGGIWLVMQLDRGWFLKLLPAKINCILSNRVMFHICLLVRDQELVRRRNPGQIPIIGLSSL